MSYLVLMAIRLENKTGRRFGRYVSYEYGEDLFGYLYIEKIKGKTTGDEKGRVVDKWILDDLASLIKTLDLEIYKREVENYENRIF